MQQEPPEMANFNNFGWRPFTPIELTIVAGVIVAALSEMTAEMWRLQSASAATTQQVTDDEPQSPTTNAKALAPASPR
jgi:hypothetical protein